jgi:cephalosporin hydroxylase
MSEPQIPLSQQSQQSPPSQPQALKLRTADVVSFFHQLYYQLGATARGTWTRTYWMGVATEKLPLDMWIYQELLHGLRPDFILETGTRHGGSALFYCQMMDLIGAPCDVVTVDIERPTQPPAHPRLSYLLGSSTAPEIVSEVKRRAAGKQRVFVVLDSDHRYPHVLAELRAYHDIVTPGSYLIVEDTNVNGNPVSPAHGPGPMEAVREFLATNSDFGIDKECEKFLFTFHPSGWLRKKPTP